MEKIELKITKQVIMSIIVDCANHTVMIVKGVRYSSVGVC